MKKSLLIASSVLGVGILTYVVYKSTKKAPAATGGRPLNSLPARMYAQNYNSNPQARPPTATFAPFSGVPFVEEVLKGFNSGWDTSVPDPSSVPDVNTSLANLSLNDL